jgi:hypothetical protein
VDFSPNKIGVVSHPYSNVLDNQCFWVLESNKRENRYFFFAGFFVDLAAFFAGAFLAAFLAGIVSLLSLFDSLTTR